MRPCIDCKSHLRVPGQNSKRCSDCSTARWIYMEYASGRTLAANEVAKAKRAGVLPEPKSFLCADCSGPAIEYDHRDYNRPLEVAPVCRRCNILRGSAVPKDWSFQEFFAWFSKSETSRRIASDRLELVRKIYFPTEQQTAAA